jgi:hypothetical protein
MWEFFERKRIMSNIRTLLQRVTVGRGGPVRAENSPSSGSVGRPAGQDNAHQDTYGPHDKTPRSDGAGPHLEAVRAIQNAPVPAKALGMEVNWKNQVHYGPELLRPQALHTLNFADSPKRSEQIVRGIKRLGIFDDKGALQYRLRGLDREMELLNSMKMGKTVGLTPKEEQGVRIYLMGLEENLQILGQDISKLPVKQRRDWLFYAGHEPSLSNSRVATEILKKAGILDRNYLPKNGGEKFDAFVEKRLSRTPDVYRPYVEHWFSEVRESLFPLPLYPNDR